MVATRKTLSSKYLFSLTNDWMLIHDTLGEVEATEEEERERE